MCPVGKMKSTCLVPSQSKVLVDAPITLCVWLVVCNLYNPQLADLLEPLNIRVVSILNLRSSVFLRLVLLLIQQKASSKNKTKQTKKRLPRSSLYNKNSVVLVLSCSTLYCRHCRYLKQIGRHKGPPHLKSSCNAKPSLFARIMNEWLNASDPIVPLSVPRAIVMIPSPASSVYSLAPVFFSLNLFTSRPQLTLPQ